MGANKIMTFASGIYTRVGFKMKKHAPDILLVTGITGVVTSAVMACKATTKVDEIMEKTRSTLDVIHEGMEKGQIEGTEYTQEDGKKDLAITYTRTAIEFAKLYGPAVLVGGSSIGCILASHNIIRQRNAALTAAYSGVLNSFKNYRSNVSERFGNVVDRELLHNIRAEEIKEKVVDEETGKKKTVTKTVSVFDPDYHSEYARFFDEYCRGWTKDAEYNMAFVVRAQNSANDLIRNRAKLNGGRGFLFLNEVYDMLGIDRTKAGQHVGWVYDEANPIGDNCIDFGIFELENEKARDFVNGRERSILLDFNVDGDVYALMT